MIEQLNWAPLFVMTLQVGYDRAQRFGTTPIGYRACFPVDGGRVEGDRLRGAVNGGGADWITIRSDGVMMIDVRLTLTTHDGALIGMTYTGLARAKDAAHAERFRNREVLSFEETFLHTTPRFETGDARYSWLNDVITVTNGMRSATGGVYHVFEIL
ncbi:hypothetical protein ASG11_04525 [Sphingomonas sp. Leaf357]|uniref:DUF3237 domain-containing protein n=1 Tax=Sphingomonas sp. Leaf357 TaxID=1736350 RepID=UPI0006FEECCF|nr:DUF3237 domain-containing protein [Sphingomonas sp. Leaf357]KQS03606.1 hypothetical protein ASG11_04525 [Sphingomonas sp. Leaf357]